MSYEKQTWNTGDTITDDKLNHMEDGISSVGSLVVNYVFGESTDTLDKTYAEIRSALLAGKTIFVKKDDSYDDPQYGYTLYDYRIVTGINEKVGTGTEETSREYYVESNHGNFRANSEDGVLTLTD